MKLTKTSALDLPLKGSIGSFKVGVNENKETFEVKYLLSHVGLNFDTGSDEKLLKELAPVREIFDFKSLDFDQIMQRDIDDSRVSSELIPYVLDDKTSDLVKFFPPIVVVALPIESDTNRPAKYYPSVTQREVNRDNDPSGVCRWLETQSGPDGQEVFKFEQPILDDDPQLHDLVKFSINTSKCKLIIVDGQHRAMALLALYRNLKEDWSDSRRKAFESYYREWTPDFIRSFNLKEIKLPMIVCTIPFLDADYGERIGEYDLRKASRSIFLTLNKNARKVSRSRNLLLDDADLVSSFMRALLSKIKNGDRDFASSHSMEIHNVELDQSGDRQAIISPMAFTGVPHLHYIVEHLLLDDGDINGISKRSGVFSKRKTNKYFEKALNRLDCENILGADAFDKISRDVFTSEDDAKLGEIFKERYGINVLKGLSIFKPFDAFSRATQTIKNIVDKHADVHLRPMLFDGQGIGRVFKEHRELLKLRLSEGYFKHDVPKIESFTRSLDDTYSNYETIIKKFEKELTKEYLSELPKLKYMVGTELLENSVTQTTRLYRNVFSTVAFQAALICGFYTEFEKNSKTFEGKLNLSIFDCFDTYLKQQSEFFKPNTFERAKTLFSLFFGETTGNDFSSLEIKDKSKNSFRKVVFSGEMTPDEWPKYKYLMLEVWKPDEAELEEKLEQQREKARKQILHSLINRNIKEYCEDQTKKESELSSIEKTSIVNDSFDSFKAMLKLLGKSSKIDDKLKTEMINTL